VLVETNGPTCAGTQFCQVAAAAQGFLLIAQGCGATGALRWSTSSSPQMAATTSATTKDGAQKSAG